VTAAILTRFAETQGRIGRRPMRQLLAQDGIACALGTVHRIMAEQGLMARRRQAWKRTTTREPAARTAQIRNHCLDATGQRSFTSPRPGAIVVSDITYLPTRAGWLYLAIVLDLATRAVIGWAVRPTLQTELVLAALTMASQQGRLPRGAILHSDRGTQYTSLACQLHCHHGGITQSMGATGVCWDNAVAESFFATFKSDLAAEVGTFATRQAAHTWVNRYIEGWYNRRRPHSWNDGLPPLLAWQQHAPHSAVSPS
jgi:transposase InsO family protein